MKIQNSKQSNKILYFRKRSRMKKVIDFIRKIFSYDPESTDMEVDYLEYEDFLNGINL